MQEAKWLFNHLNQKGTPWHSMYCTVYAPCINLKYNTGIELWLEDIKKIAEIATKKGNLDVKKGWPLQVNFLEVYDYVKDKYPKLKYKIFRVESMDYKTYFNKWYMIEVWIKVNKQFTYDAQDDGAIDEKDYSKLKWEDLKHATNVLKWIKKSEDFGKSFMFDNYFWHKAYNLVEVHPQEFKKVLMNNAYFFYLED